MTVTCTTLQKVTLLQRYAVTTTVRKAEQNFDIEKIGYIEAGKVNKVCWQHSEYLQL
jgi:hypothetical protein